MMSMGWENKIPFGFDVLGPTVAEILELYSIRFGLKIPNLMTPREGPGVNSVQSQN